VPYEQTGWENVQLLQSKCKVGGGERQGRGERGGGGQGGGGAAFEEVLEGGDDLL